MKPVKKKIELSSNGGVACVRCSEGKPYDSNGLCIKCNFNKMMGGQVV